MCAADCKPSRCEGHIRNVFYRPQKLRIQNLVQTASDLSYHSTRLVDWEIRCFYDLLFRGYQNTLCFLKGKLTITYYVYFLKCIFCLCLFYFSVYIKRLGNQWNCNIFWWHTISNFFINFRRTRRTKFIAANLTLRDFVASY